MRQEFANHSVQEIAIGFVCFASIDGHTNIVAAVERCMCTLMDQRRNAVIEDANQVKILACGFIDEMLAYTIEHGNVSQRNTKCTFGLYPFLFASAEIDIGAMEQRYKESWYLRPFDFCHSSVPVISWLVVSPLA
ncbi:hypothetical protein A3N45_05100 [Klebsiella aerogenes]|nr:hypothetical protein A3N45_05100 [Klebsiella aerogenes]